MLEICCALAFQKHFGKAFHRYLSKTDAKVRQTFYLLQIFSQKNAKKNQPRYFEAMSYPEKSRHI